MKKKKTKKKKRQARSKPSHSSITAVFCPAPACLGWTVGGIVVAVAGVKGSASVDANRVNDLVHCLEQDTCGIVKWIPVVASATVLNLFILKLTEAETVFLVGQSPPLLVDKLISQIWVQRCSLADQPVAGNLILFVGVLVSILTDFLRHRGLVCICWTGVCAGRCCTKLILEDIGDRVHSIVDFRVSKASVDESDTSQAAKLGDTVALLRETARAQNDTSNTRFLGVRIGNVVVGASLGTLFQCACVRNFLQLVARDVAIALDFE